MKILVADDNQDDLSLLSMVLRRQGYEVDTANNGFDALTKVQQNGFDIIISDILMPKMDGFQFCRKVKANPKLKYITFIFYTATYTSPQDEKFAYSLGADNFVIKPKEPEIFIKILREIIKNRQEKKIVVSPPPCEEEVVYLKKYNERLIKKLESKVNELEETNRNLVQNINQRKLAENALAVEKECLVATLQSKERLAVTLRSIGDAIVTLDMEGRIISLNKVAEELTGWTQKEAEGKPFAEVIHLISDQTRLESESLIKNVLESGKTLDLARDTLLIDGNGQERMIAGNVVLMGDKKNHNLGLVMAFRDITEKKRIEEELQKDSKLKSLGILAGGIAHDFNNILTAIIGNISLAKVFMNQVDNLDKTLTEVEKASLSAKSLTHQLLTFAVGGAPVKKTMDITELLKNSVHFSLRGSRTDGLFSIPEALWPVEIDEGLISQAINNIIINADQAMPEGGTILVQAKNMSLTQEKIAHGLLLPRGDYIEISIKDQGVGISRENLKKVFDPYFTTKQTGSGLGLTASYSIIKNHGGYLTAESEMGVGTIFLVYLPSSPKELISPEKMLEVEKVEEITLPGKGKILVMDDEEMIRSLLNDMLTYTGYEVVCAQNGTEAIDLYLEAQKSGRPIDVVIMDLIIPGGMGGEEAMKKLIEIDPQVKALVSSGYSTHPIMANYKHYGFIGCVDKPYDRQTLLKKVGAIIKEKNKKPFQNND